MLGTTLLGLALSTELIVVSLTALVASQARDGTANGSLSTVGETRTEVAELALGLLLLALEVLLTTGCLEGLCKSVLVIVKLHSMW